VAVAAVESILGFPPTPAPSTTPADGTLDTHRPCVLCWFPNAALGNDHKLLA
jgi:hypothetical protein